MKNPDGVQHGVKQITIDGEEICGNVIRPDMLAGKKAVDVKVVLG